MAACVAAPSPSWRDLEVFLRDFKGCKGADAVRRGREAADALQEVPPQALDAVRTAVEDLCEAMGEVVRPEGVELEVDRMEDDRLEFVEGTVQTLAKVLGKLRESVVKFETQGQLEKLVESLGPIVVPPLFFTEKLAFSNEWREAIGPEKYVQSCKEVVQKLAIGGSLKLIESVLHQLQHQQGVGSLAEIPAKVIAQVWTCLLRIGVNSSTAEHMDGPLKSYFVINFAWSRLAWIQELGICDCRHPEWAKNTEFTLSEVHDLLCRRVMDSFERLMQLNEGCNGEGEAYTCKDYNVSEESAQEFTAGLKVVRFWLQHLCKFIEHNYEILYHHEEESWQELIRLIVAMTLKSVYLQKELAFLVCNNLLVLLHRSAREIIVALSDSSESSHHLTTVLLQQTLEDGQDNDENVDKMYAGLVTLCGTFSSQNIPRAVLEDVTRNCHVIMNAIHTCVPLLMDNAHGIVEPYDGSTMPGFPDFLAEFAVALLRFEDDQPEAVKEGGSPWNRFETFSLQGLLSIDMVVHHCFAMSWLRICHELDEQVVYAHCSAVLNIVERLVRGCTDRRRCPPLQLERAASFIVMVVEQSRNPCLQEKVSKLLARKFTEHDTSPGQLLFLSAIVEAQGRIRPRGFPLPIAEVDRLAVETLNVLEGLKTQSRLEASSLLQIGYGYRFLKAVSVLMPDGTWFGRARMLAKEHFARLVPALYCGTCAVEAYFHLLDFLVVLLEEGMKREVLTLCQPVWDQQWCSKVERSRLALFLTDLVIGESQMSLPMEAWHFLFTVEEPLVAHLVMTAFVEFSRSPAAYGVDLRRLLPDSGMAFFDHNKATPEEGDFHAALKEYLSHDQPRGFSLMSKRERSKVRRDVNHLQQRLARLSVTQDREQLQESRQGMISEIVTELQELAARLSSNQATSIGTEASLRQKVAHTKSVIDRLEQCI